MRLMLAPMEGLVDDALRAALARIGGYDCAVSEFVRVSASCLPAHVFRRMVPELDHGSCIHGMPVRVQLLGADPGLLADNAAVLASLKPAAVDLNFGCPAPTVNRHGGGAVLLDEPERLYAIACAVRAVLPAALMLTAKMRLGVADTARALDCAQALVEGGVAELVVHARTRDEAYRPPAHWEWVGRIGEVVRVPVVANGEVWTVADWARCCGVAGVSDVMLARGAVVDPFLARRIRARGEPHADDEALRAAEWRELCPVLAGFRDQVMRKVKPGHAAGRIKQWLNLLRRRYAQAELVYQRIRPLTAMAAIDEVFAAAGVVAGTGRVM
ncbi:tRNA-dihydrouridine(16) synthase [Betaproteobacteria bacterium]|nr:tRNA-dihydrouridine(16) synthase [Betaproteobacteria bacterium]GHU17802.1 tRNA-dihydrouridine(16) synthase [Betaproteobacteria bacterium]